MVAAKPPSLTLHATFFMAALLAGLAVPGLETVFSELKRSSWSAVEIAFQESFVTVGIPRSVVLAGGLRRASCTSLSSAPARLT
jgi:hypothetical protein